jgi:cell division protein ZapE
MQLCGAPLSAADYLALCAVFDVFLLVGVPATRGEDELRRFVNLVDVLYDSGKLLLLSAHAPLDVLFAAEQAELAEATRKAQGAPTASASQLGLAGGATLGVSVSGAGGSSGRSTTMVGGVEWSATGRVGASLAHLGGNFARAASPRAHSRLRQMMGRTWAAAWAERNTAPRGWLPALEREQEQEQKQETHVNVTS